MADYRRARKWGIVGTSITLVSFSLYLLYYPETYLVNLAGLAVIGFAVREIAQKSDKKLIFSRFAIGLALAAVASAVDTIYVYLALAGSVSQALLVIGVTLSFADAVFILISFTLITKVTSIGSFRISAILSLVSPSLFVLSYFASGALDLSDFIAIAATLFLIVAFASLGWVWSLPKVTQFQQGHGQATFPGVANKSFYRDYLFTEEGVYRVELLSDEQRILAEYWWFFIFAAGVTLPFLETLDILFVSVAVIGLVINRTLSRAIGRRKRTLFLADLNRNQFRESVRLIPWSGFRQAVLTDNAISMVFVDGMKDVAGIRTSDDQSFKSILAAKFGDNLVLK